MASDPEIKILFKAQTKELKKAFKEIEQLQKKLEKTKKTAQAVETKAIKDQRKEFKDLVKEKDKHYKSQSKALTDHHKQMQKTFNLERREAQRQRSEFERTRRQQLGHVRDVNREIKRGPIGRFVGGAGKAALGGAAFAGAGLLGMLIGASLKGYQNLVMTNEQLGPSIGLGKTNMMGAAKNAGRGRGGNLGFNVAERGALIPAMARATGNIGPRPLMEGMRATGMSADEVAGMYGTIRQGGNKFNGIAEMMGAGGKTSMVDQAGSGKKEFEKVIAMGMYSGLERARLPEFFGGVTHLMKTQQSINTGNVGTKDLSKLLALIGSTGKSGLQGERGAGVMAKLQQGILQPGGGDAGRAFMLQAFGFGKPGGTASYYEASKQQEKGLGDGNVMKVMAALQQQHGSGQDAVMYLQDLTGLSKQQGEDLISVFNSNKAVEDKMKDMDKILDDSKSLEEQSAEHMEKAATNLEHISKMFDLSVGDGEKSAAAITKIEGYQREMLDWMYEKLPVIWEELKKILAEIKEFLKLTIGVFIKGFNAIPGVPDIEDPFKSGSVLRQEKLTDAAKEVDALTTLANKGSGDIVGSGTMARAATRHLAGAQMKLLSARKGVHKDSMIDKFSALGPDAANAIAQSSSNFVTMGGRDSRPDTAQAEKYAAWLSKSMNPEGIVKAQKEGTLGQIEEAYRRAYLEKRVGGTVTTKTGAPLGVVDPISFVVEERRPAGSAHRPGTGKVDQKRAASDGAP